MNLNRNGENLGDEKLDELERIVAEVRCLARRCRKLEFSEISYFLGIAEDSAKQTLSASAATEVRTQNPTMEDDNVCDRIIPFRTGS